MTTSLLLGFVFLLGATHGAQAAEAKWYEGRWAPSAAACENTATVIGATSILDRGSEMRVRPHDETEATVSLTTWSDGDNAAPSEIEIRKLGRRIALSLGGWPSQTLLNCDRIANGEDEELWAQFEKDTVHAAVTYSRCGDGIRPDCTVLSLACSNSPRDLFARSVNLFGDESRSLASELLQVPGTVPFAVFDFGDGEIKMPLQAIFVWRHVNPDLWTLTLSSTDIDQIFSEINSGVAFAGVKIGSHWWDLSSHDGDIEKLTQLRQACASNNSDAVVAANPTSSETGPPSESTAITCLIDEGIPTWGRYNNEGPRTEIAFSLDADGHLLVDGAAPDSFWGPFKDGRFAVSTLQAANAQIKAKGSALAAGPMGQFLKPEELEGLNMLAEKGAFGLMEALGGEAVTTDDGNSLSYLIDFRRRQVGTAVKQADASWPPPSYLMELECY